MLEMIYGEQIYRPPHFLKKPVDRSINSSSNRCDQFVSDPALDLPVFDLDFIDVPETHSGEKIGIKKRPAFVYQYFELRGKLFKMTVVVSFERNR